MSETISSLTSSLNDWSLLVFTDCSLRDLSPSLVEENRVCGSVSGGGVCYSGDSVGSVAVYFCDDGYSLEGDTTSLVASGMEPLLNVWR